MQASRAAFAVSGAGVVRAAVPATAAASRTRRSTVGSVAALSAVGVAAVAVGVASLVRPQPGRGAGAALVLFGWLSSRVWVVRDARHWVRCA